jgi:surface glycoprotein (TIGR04207 family)
MTGERRKKIQSVILSAIMVLSVVAMSATIFAGSAAAIEDGSGQIIADPATEEVTSTHTVNLTVADSGIAVDNNNNIQAFRIDYSNDTNIGDNDNDIDVTNVDVDSLTLYVVDPDGADDQLTTLNGGDTDFDVLTNSNGDIEVEVETTLDDTLSGDEEIFIEVADIVNPSADNSPYSDVQVSVGTSSGLTGNDDVAASQHSDSENVELVIGDGPIEANIGETDLFYNTFDKAVADATTSEDTITVVEDLDQTGTNPTLATATTISPFKI